jgi:hypothetical protein
MMTDEECLVRNADKMWISVQGRRRTKADIIALDNPNDLDIAKIFAVFRGCPTRCPTRINAQFYDSNSFRRLEHS